MRYIGGKSEILDQIMNVANEMNIQSMIDVFAGSGVVSMRFAENGVRVKSNDMLYFSYVLNRGQLSPKPKFSQFDVNPISFLNSLTLESSDITLKECFIRNNYSFHEGCDRMYFQERNAIKIDIIRITLERWRLSSRINDDEYFYLLSRLIAAVPFISNIAGVYGAYLKHWDSRSYKDLMLTDSECLLKPGCDHQAYNMDYIDLLSQVSSELLYADPPYNSRQYLPNYHILETIAKYDHPHIHGISGMRNYGASEKSVFCSKATVHRAFEGLIRCANVDNIIISYNNEGLISTRDLIDVCQSFARSNTFKLIQIPYKRYSSHSSGSGMVYEQLYVFKKR